MFEMISLDDVVFSIAVCSLLEAEDGGKGADSA
jgi:hypothetical protein